MASRLLWIVAAMALIVGMTYRLSPPWARGSAFALAQAGNSTADASDAAENSQGSPLALESAAPSARNEANSALLYDVGDKAYYATARDIDDERHWAGVGWYRELESASHYLACGGVIDPSQNELDAVQGLIDQMEGEDGLIRTAREAFRQFLETSSEDKLAAGEWTYVPEGPVGERPGMGTAVRVPPYNGSWRLLQWRPEHHGTLLFETFPGENPTADETFADLQSAQDLFFWELQELIKSFDQGE